MEVEERAEQRGSWRGQISNPDGRTIIEIRWDNVAAFFFLLQHLLNTERVFAKSSLFNFAKVSRYLRTPLTDDNATIAVWDGKFDWVSPRQGCPVCDCLEESRETKK